MNYLQQLQMEAWMEGAFFGSFLVVLLFLMFQVKHLVVDFFVQNRFPYMWLNKGRLFHLGGWLHAGSHGLGSFLGLLLFGALDDSVKAIQLCLAETWVHFLIDYYKMRIGAWRGWKCNTSPYFWDLLGVDQFLHQLTYLGMVLVWIFA